MELMGTGDATLLEVVLVVDALEGHFSGSVEVPEGTVEVEKEMTVGFVELLSC